MRSRIGILLALVVCCSLLFAQGGRERVAADHQEAEKKIIHLKSDLSGPIAPGDSVLFLVGNVAAQHNGAVITCDSAVRYSDTRIECFGNVLINKNTTYMYGDRADYDGILNEVQVYSHIVKVIDGDATLYTYNFSFNTKDNIGRFWDGGVLTNRDNVVESERGYYYSNEKNLIAVENVEMHNDEYDMRGDSVCYNTATDHAYFYNNTHIWDADGNYLYGNRGEYSKAEQRYMVTENSYLLTETQEMWSDTLDYFRADQYVVMRNNLQINETEHKNLIFGDYGEYWEATGKGFLTKDPVLINYDTERNADSIFMRSDSLYLYLLKIGDPIPNEYAVEEPMADSVGTQQTDSLAAEVEQVGSMQLQVSEEALSREATAVEVSAVTGAIAETQQPTLSPEDEQVTGQPMEEQHADSSEERVEEQNEPALPRARKRLTEQLQEKGQEETSAQETQQAEVATTGEAAPTADSVQLDGADAIPADTLSPKERLALEKQRLKEAARAAAEAKRAEKAAAKKILLDSIGEERQRRANIKLRAIEERDSIKQAARKEKARAKMQARMERDRRKGIVHLIDSATFRQVDSLVPIDLNFVDSIMGRFADSLDSLHRITLLITPTDTTQVIDSMYRFVKGFRNVKIYRTDFQAVCDSLTARSLDSTAHLYLKPVLWNETNQITSEVMDIYTANSQIEHAEFVGDPMMASQFDTVYYDQIRGKEMFAYFADNDLYRVDVNGNVQTIFFQKDGMPQQVVMMAVIESGDATFYIEERQLAKIVYRTNPVWPIYPIDRIPADVSMYLEGFKWEGERRPTRNEIFNRTERPSQREENEQQPLPKFPIRQFIDAQRERYVKAGMWADRNEEVDIQTVEWMRSLGFEVGQPYPER